mgnify:CR=1 FL=1
MHFLQQMSQQANGHSFNHVKLRVKAMKGGVSGGTVASSIEMAKAAKQDPSLRRNMGNPHVLCRQSDLQSARQPRLIKTTYDPAFKAWSSNRTISRSDGIFLPDVFHVDE